MSLGGIFNMECWKAGAKAVQKPVSKQQEEGMYFDRAQPVQS